MPQHVSMTVNLETMPEGWQCFTIGKGNPCIAPPHVAELIVQLRTERDICQVRLARSIKHRKAAFELLQKHYAIVDNVMPNDLEALEKAMELVHGEFQVTDERS